MRLQSGTTGDERPQPVEIRSILRHRQLRVVLARGQEGEFLEFADAGPEMLGIQLGGIRRTEISRGDFLIG